MTLLLCLGAGLALLWGVTLWKATRHEARSEAAYPPLGRIIAVKGRKVHYVQRGSGPDVVLIHGASGNLRDFTFDLMGRLGTAGFRVTAFDRPGLGYTDRLDRDGASIFEQAAFLSAAAAKIGLDRPVVLGHSYGGAVALAWATRHPERVSALVLLAAASHPWEAPLSLYYRVLSHPVGQWIAPPLLGAWVPDHVVTDTIGQIFAPQATPEGYAGHIGAGLTLRRASLRENALQRASILSEIRQMGPDYAQLDLPVEILHGTEDTTVWLSIHAEPLAAQVPGAQLARLQGVGHAPHHSDPAAVVAAVIRAADRAGLR